MRSNLTSLILFIILLSLSKCNPTPTYLSFLSDYESDVIILTTGTFTTASGFDSQSTNLNFLQAYSTAPTIALAVSQFDGVTPGSNIQFQIQPYQKSSIGMKINFTCTSGLFTKMAVSYIATIFSGFNIQLITIYFAALTAIQLNPLKYNYDISYPVKNNVLNVLVQSYIVGATYSCIDVIYKITLQNYQTTQNFFTLTITVPTNNVLTSVKISIIDYEIGAPSINSPKFLDFVSSDSNTGSITDKSGINLPITPSMFYGISSFSYDLSSSSIINLEVVFNTLSFSIITKASSTNTFFFWYRELSCPKYYLIQSNNLNCLSCDYTCYTCSSLTNISCLTCNPDDHRTFLNSNNSCPCDANYIDLGIYSCQLMICPNNCKTCSNINVCDSCLSTDNRILTDDQCICIDGYFDTGVSTICSMCDYSCKTCEINKINCTSCKRSNIRSFNQLTNSCPCNDGYYDGSLALCFACHYSCNRCLDSTNCIDCNILLHRNLSSTVPYCICLDGYYDDLINQICKTCNYSCLTCNKTQCLTCDATTRSLLGGRCICKNGYYDNGFSLTCIACQYSCLSCTNSTACATCDSINHFRTLNLQKSFYCLCISKYTQQNIPNQICAACDITCDNCSAVSSSQCTSCNSTAFRILNVSSGLSGPCVCKSGYYQISPTQEICGICNYKCKTCSSSPSACITCGTNRNITNSCSCYLGYFQNNTESCPKCSFYCNSCIQSITCNDCHSSRTLNTSNICICNIGLYDDGINQICPSCMVTCHTCVNPINCSSCLSSSFRQFNAYNQCVCIIRYYQKNPVVSACFACNYSCLTCSISANHCLSCNASAFRVLNTTSSLCQCQNGYYDDGANQLCVLCPYSCETCSNNTQCLLCNIGLGRKKISSSLCECMDKYYDNMINQSCDICHYTCATCSNSSACITCDINKFRNQTINSTSSLCDCIQNYYDDGSNQLCLTCPYSCFTCNNALCVSCNNSDFRYFLSNQCPCLNGYYDAGVEQCSQCHYSCRTCVSSTSCLTCNFSYYRQLSSSFLCNCINGYYDDGSSSPSCLACNFTCLTCSGPNTCLSCNFSYFRALSTTFLCSCLPYYYSISTIQCYPCFYSCLTCNNSTQCLSCDSDAHRVLNITSNLCDCMNTYYDSKTNSSKCLSCNYTCQTCTNSTSCETCLSTYHRYLLSGNCLCSNGYYDNGATATCSICLYSCYKCTNPINCTTCIPSSNRVLNISNFACICLSGYYDDGVSQNCQVCKYNCDTCSNDISCLTCNISNYRILNQSSSDCVCLSGYYDDSTNTKCLKCHHSCFTCQNNMFCSSCSASASRNTTLLSNSICICQDGYYDDGINQLCLPCHYTCATCINSTSCLTCSSLAFRTLNNNRCICTTGYFDSLIYICSMCAYSCTNCIQSPTNCISCDSTLAPNNRILINGSCVCSQHYYDNNSNNICAPCIYSCSSCNNSTNCVTCNIAYYRILDTTTRNCICQIGYFDDNIEACQTCNYTCYQCIGSSSNCVSCNYILSYRNLVITVDSNSCVCDQHFFDNSSFICLPCKYYCSSCTNISSCLTCNNSNNRIINVLTNQCDCILYFYDDSKFNQVCLACHYSCLSCKNNTACLNCDSTLHRYLNNTPSLCLCMPSYYDDGTNRLCASCLYSCKTCTNSTKCLTCEGLLKRIQNSNSQCICSNGYFDNGSNQVCQPCLYSCQTCTNAIQCTSCNSTYLRTLINLQCICNQHYYDDFYHMLCLSCNYVCNSCSNSLYCMTCNSTKFRVKLGSTCVCQNGYYDDGINQLCLPCHYSCLTCVNSSSCSTCDITQLRYYSNTNCICQQNYYDDSLHMLCLMCSYQCLTCTSSSSTTCLTCNSTNHRNFSVNSCPCTFHFYDDGIHSLCLPCLYNCLTCIDNIQCQTCNSTNKRIKSGTSCLCKQHYYDDLVNEQCLACQYTCSSCNNIFLCLTCNATNFRIFNISTGFCDCMQNYLDLGINSEVCFPCNPSCLTCTSLTKCDSCNASNYRLLNNTANFQHVKSRFCVCFDRYFPLNSSVCAPCLYSCMFCTNSSSNGCLQCNGNAYRILSNGNCNCLAQTFDDGINELCANCNFTCLTCNLNANNCQSCLPTFYFLASQSSCFVICPSTYWNDNSTYNCTPCSNNCNICSNSSYCSQCKNSFYLSGLFPVICVSMCSKGFYADINIQKCMLCLPSCLLCTDLYVCTACQTGYYLDKAFSLCYPCSTLCSQCSGPSGIQCLSCIYPLYLKSNMCVNLTCSYSQYIDPISGCVSCNKFIGAITCTIQKIISCQTTYLLNSTSNKCIACSAMTGYYIDNKQICREICGDGLLFVLACDDGNNLDGDGCSSSCIIQNGWNCTNQNTKTPNSNCFLIIPLKISPSSIKKIAGANILIIIIKMSIPIRLINSNFIISVGSNIYTYNITMVSLILYQLTLYYNATLQNSDLHMQVRFSILKRLLQQQTQKVTQFNFSFTIQSYPPAIFYPDQTKHIFDKFSQVIRILSIVNLTLACLCLFGYGKITFYAIQSINLLLMLYVYEGYSMSSYTDWLKYSILKMKQCILITGFSLGNCKCFSIQQSFESDYGYNSQMMQNGGVVAILIIILVIIYEIALILSKIQIKKKQQQHYQYKNLFLQRFLKVFEYYLINILFSFTMNPVFSTLIYIYKWPLTSTAAAINLYLSILFVFFYIGFLGIYFKRIKNIKIIQVNIQDLNCEFSKVSAVSGEDNSKFDKIETKQKNVIIQSQQFKKEQLEEKDRAIAFFTPQTELNQNIINLPNKFQKNIDNQYLILEFKNLFNEAHYSKYYLFIFQTKLFIQLICISFFQKFPLSKFFPILIAQIMFLTYILFMRPFKSKLNNLKSFIINIQIIALLLINIVIISYNKYIYTLEYIGVVGIIIVLSTNLLFLAIQIIMSYWEIIQQKIYPCILKFKLKKKPQKFISLNRDKLIIQDVNKIEEEAIHQIPQEQQIQIDAFFNRIIKKNKINKQYRRQRMMKIHN